MPDPGGGRHAGHIQRSDGSRKNAMRRLALIGQTKMKCEVVPSPPIARAPVQSRAGKDHAISRACPARAVI
jgi:hypothetical protein